MRRFSCTRSLHALNFPSPIARCWWFFCTPSFHASIFLHQIVLLVDFRIPDHSMRRFFYTRSLYAYICVDFSFSDRSMRWFRILDCSKCSRSLHASSSLYLIASCVDVPVSDRSRRRFSCTRSFHASIFYSRSRHASIFLYPIAPCVNFYCKTVIKSKRLCWVLSKLTDYVWYEWSQGSVDKEFFLSPPSPNRRKIINVICFVACFHEHLATRSFDPRRI